MTNSLRCHPERSEGSLRPSRQTLRCAQDDRDYLPMPEALTSASTHKKCKYSTDSQQVDRTKNISQGQTRNCKTIACPHARHSTGSTFPNMPKDHGQKWRSNQYHSR